MLTKNINTLGSVKTKCANAKLQIDEKNKRRDDFNENG